MTVATGTGVVEGQLLQDLAQFSSIQEAFPSHSPAAAHPGQLSESVSSHESRHNIGTSTVNTHRIQLCKRHRVILDNKQYAQNFSQVA